MGLSSGLGVLTSVLNIISGNNPLHISVLVQVLQLTIGIAQLVGVWLLWNWKINGLYLNIGLAIVGLLINIFLFGPQLGVMSVIFALIGIGILYLAMKPVWKNFK